MRTDAAGPSAKLLRGALALLEKPYALLMRARNHLYDRNLLPSHPLGRAAISVGNLTTGGAGKTPLVRWLADQLHQRGWTPAILLRGYAARNGRSDEETELRQLLQPTLGDQALVKSGPSRLASAQKLLKEHPRIDLFLLDDAFQHRRARRDLDLVLINAAEPFGFGHILPRGLLREPLSGLKRADAIILTRADAASPADLESITRTLRAHNPSAPIYRSRHAITGWIDPANTLHPPAAIQNQPLSLFCGIGDPASFDRQIRSMCAQVVSSHFFPDHHPYTLKDLHTLSLCAPLLLTTEKDWVKLTPLFSPTAPPNIWRARLSLQWLDDDDQKLLSWIEARLGKARIP